MHDVILVRVIERVGEFPDDRGDFVRREALALLKQLAQFLPLQIFHDDIGRAAFAGGIVDRDDIGMGQAAGGARLVDELRFVLLFFRC